MASFRHFYLLALVVPAGLQPQGPNSHAKPANITVHSDLVLINALVTDRQGRAVSGLDATRFRLTDDGKEQAVRYCATEDVPVSIGLILDTSGSMSSKMALLKQAATHFIGAGNEGDEYFIIEFRNRPRLALPFAKDLNRLTQSVRDLKAGGSTPLLDALNMAISAMRHANHSRKAMLIVSDGLDNHSRYTESEMKRLVSELELPIYAINVYERPYGNRYATQRRDPDILEAISTPTGGRTFRVLSPKTISAVAELIAYEIRQEYILGYVPSNHQRDGKFHRVHVQVDPLAGKKFRVSHRQGYIAPPQ